MTAADAETRRHPAARPADPARPGAAQRFGELRLAGVSRDYGAHTALHPLDLTVRGGEFIALLGPSGCGKTTALNCVAGLLPLTSGAIELDGRRIDTLPPEKRGFGMVFQNYALFPHLSVRANVAFGLKMRGLPKPEVTRRVDEVLRVVRLTEQAQKHPGQLSGGQQQRVAIARAIVLEPPLVLMDEPLSNLDASLRLDMRAEIRRIHQQYGLTTVYVTHDQEEALSLADRLVVLDAGRVAQVGTPAELYGAPASAYVAAFMGYRNVMSLAVDGTNGGTVAVSGQGVSLRGTVVGGAAVSPGDAVQAAVRPDDVHIVDAAAPAVPSTDTGQPVFEAVAEVVEYHGRTLHVVAATGSGQRVHVNSDHPVAPGDTLALTADPAKVLVFAEAAPAAQTVAAAAGTEAEAL